MSNEKDFRLSFVKLLEDEASREFPGNIIKIISILEVNGEEDFVCLFDKEKCIHKESFLELYKEYKQGYSLPLLVSNFTGRVHMAYQRKKLLKKKPDRDELLKSITAQVIDGEKNRKLLKSIVHQEIFSNLRLVFRKEENNHTSLVTKNDLIRLKLNEDDIFLAALANTFSNRLQIFDLKIVDPDFGYNEEEVLLFARTENSEYGANVLLNPRWLDESAENLGGTMYIEPFSMKGIILHNLDPLSKETRAKIKSAKKVIENSVSPGIKEDLSSEIYVYKTDSPWIVRIPRKEGKEK